MKITPVNKTGDHRTGSLTGLNVADVTRILGFAPNCEDDPDKVENSWGFEVDGVLCGVWDYKGSMFSTFGPADTLRKVFGANYR
jgi:hypothetical protein